MIGLTMKCQIFFLKIVKNGKRDEKESKGNIKYDYIKG